MGSFTCHSAGIDSRLSLTGKKWKLSAARNALGPELALMLLSERELQLPPRGGDSWADGLFNAFDIPDLPIAARRIMEAIERKDRVTIFGDYDCDGITSTAQMLRFFRRHGIEPWVRLPHRVRDGYGLTAKIVDECAAKGTDLLVTVDTGVSAHDAVHHAHEKGMDVIILDHHRVQGGPPPALAVIHPAFATTPPVYAPSAAGVVFSLLHALEGEEWEGRKEDLALATIGTIADLVPLKGCNRALVQRGLEAIMELQDCPLAHLVSRVCRPGGITSQDIAFRIAPRINAAGRMDDPTLALTALMNGGEALDVLETLNVERQAQTALLVEQALQGLVEPHPPILITAHADYSHGIIGLIAGKLTEAYGRPSMVGAIHGESVTASLRSPACYNIMDGLTHASDLLTTFGGHAQAAGCSFPLAHLPLLQERLSAHVLSLVDQTDLLPTLTLDAALDLSHVTLGFCRSFAVLAPHGSGNPEPTFLLKNVMLDRVRRVGTDERHLQAMIGQCKAIGFNLGHLGDATHQRLDIACRLGIDSWNGRETPQIFVEDMRIADLVPYSATIRGEARITK